MIDLTSQILAHTHGHESFLNNPQRSCLMIDAIEALICFVGCDMTHIVLAFMYIILQT